MGVQFPEKKRYVTLEWPLGAIQVLRNADGGGGCLIFWKKAVRRCNV